MRDQRRRQHGNRPLGMLSAVATDAARTPPPRTIALRCQLGARRVLAAAPEWQGGEYT